MTSGWAESFLPYLLWTAIIVGTILGIVSGVNSAIKRRKVARKEEAEKEALMIERLQEAGFGEEEE